MNYYDSNDEAIRLGDELVIKLNLYAPLSTKHEWLCQKLAEFINQETEERKHGGA